MENMAHTISHDVQIYILRQFFPMKKHKKYANLVLFKEYFSNMEIKKIFLIKPFNLAAGYSTIKCPIKNLKK